MPEYHIVNPIIGGSLKTIVSGKNSLEAANKSYLSISENFNNNIPEFYFTLQEKKSDKTQLGGGKLSEYSHFLVTETKKKDKVSYKIKNYNIDDNSENLKRFRKEIKKITKKTQHAGGEHKKHSYDDDDDDYLFDDDELYFPKMKKSHVLSHPISYWWYDPYLYRVKKYYIPTWTAPLSPYISIPVYVDTYPY